MVALPWASQSQFSHIKTTHFSREKASANIPGVWKHLGLRMELTETRSRKRHRLEMHRPTPLDDLYWCVPSSVTSFDHTEVGATSWACVGFSLEEERVMQQSSVSIPLSFENQGINPVGEYATRHRIPTQTNTNLQPTQQRGCQSVHGYSQSEIW